MKQKHLTNLAASVKSRLLQLSKDRGEDYNLTLAAFVGERFLYRLGRSPYASRFILKGAYLLNILFERQGYRTTRDIDVLDGHPERAPQLRKTLKAILTADVPPDGIEFRPDTITVDEIRQQNIYRGLRAKVDAYLERSKVRLQIDIGFGDSVAPPAHVIECPSLLDFESAQVLAYPMEAVIAEKLDAMVNLGKQTSRMKDYFDLHVILQAFTLSGESVAEAVRATFAKRRTPIPASTPEALDAALADDPTKQTQWTAFLRKIEVHSLELGRVVALIRQFSDEVWNVVRNNDIHEATQLTWQAGAGWQREINSE